MKTAIAGRTSRGNDFLKFSMDSAEYVQLDNDCEGLCVFCGESQSGVEPDARGYACENCGRRGVFGAEELLCRGLIAFDAE